ncbi:Uncharacterised protein [Yersinia aldovae]|uniref:hypothetical protein n=1 Tax=Yersinia aldovae TaxID=29483 RepID=UPI0005AC346D|nr:hypothetical protein [Yersinia aldovae]AJJ61720.1 hypothetical protein AT01_3976 [Yersinia aldovae 670-83]CNJ46181.1 Uncharacterised protein [Yersinia aldovae]
MCKNLWIGNNPPIGFVGLDPICIDGSGSLNSIEHFGKYTEIQFAQFAISSFRNWPIILDYIFRFTNGECLFEIRFNSIDKYFSIPKFYRLIYLFSNGSINFLSIRNYEDKPGEYVIRFTATRRSFNNDPGWSFGILWDGKNESYLRSFIESIESQTEHNNAYEIIVCGPEIINSYKTEIRFIESDDVSELYSNISRKKNKIIKSARYNNICITHNRYELASNFIKSFESIKYEYDVCIIPQKLKNTDVRVPDWVSQASDQKLTSNYLIDYGEYSPYQYIPGGLVISKRDILLANPFNELATWDMAEDIELSQRLTNLGYQFKLNKKTHANVLSLRKEILDDFKVANIDRFYENIDLFSIENRVTEGKNLKKYFFLAVNLFKNDPKLLLKVILKRMGFRNESE